MTDRLPEITAQLASVDANKRVRSLRPNLTRVYLDWLVAEVERLRGALKELEWDRHDARCPICLAKQPSRAGDHDGCWLGVLLYGDPPAEPNILERLEGAGGRIVGKPFDTPQVDKDGEA